MANFFTNVLNGVASGAVNIGNHFFGGASAQPQGGQITRICNVANIVAFTEVSLDQKAMSGMIKKNKETGLSDPLLEENLTKGNYKPVLEAVWCESDRKRCFEWLKSKEDTLDPLLMFELGVAAFQQNKTEETLSEVSIPLLAAARFRVMQDSQCSDDASVYNGDQGTRMIQTYVKRIMRIAEKKGINVASALVASNANGDAKIKEVAAKSKLVPLNSPVWVSSHGMMAIFGEDTMHPEATWKERRDNFADETISEFK